jgi:hypothetical protein
MPTPKVPTLLFLCMLFGTFIGAVKGENLKIILLTLSLDENLNGRQIFFARLFLT